VNGMVNSGTVTVTVTDTGAAGIASLTTGGMVNSGKVTVKSTGTGAGVKYSDTDDPFVSVTPPNLNFLDAGGAGTYN
jgi:hypothetical protein